MCGYLLWMVALDCVTSNCVPARKCLPDLYKTPSILARGRVSAPDTKHEAALASLKPRACAKISAMNQHDPDVGALNTLGLIRSH